MTSSVAAFLVQVAQILSERYRPIFSEALQDHRSGRRDRAAASVATLSRTHPGAARPEFGRRQAAPSPRSGRNFLPHHEPMIRSGSRATTSSMLTTRSLAEARPGRSAKMSLPPVISTKSVTYPGLITSTSRQSLRVSRRARSCSTRGWRGCDPIPAAFATRDAIAMVWRNSYFCSAGVAVAGPSPTISSTVSPSLAPS